MLRNIICCVFTLVLTGAVSLQAQVPDEQPRNPGHGVRVIEVIPGGQAERAGIQSMDLLSKYGKFQIVDHSSYYKAREFYLKTPKVKVKLEFWRGNDRMVIEVFPGGLGVDTNEYNPVLYQLDVFVKHAEILRQVPVYLRNVEFKDEFEKNGIDDLVAKAKAMLEQAEGEGTLTATEILVERIRLIPDDAPVEEQKKQEELVAQFIRGQAAEYIGYLGQHLIPQNHFRPARELLKQYLLADPDNLSVRLDLGHAALMLGLWDEAETMADLVLTDPERLDPDELVIAYHQKATGAINRGDAKTAITFAEKAFEIEEDDYDLILMQLAAATAGDVTKFNDVSVRFKEKLPKDYETFKLMIDSAEALALAVSGQDEQARAVIARWAEKDRVEGRIRNYWKNYPAGNKVIENWLRLAQN
jgi:tetratricopeptide (TPR) repeat protein